MIDLKIVEAGPHHADLVAIKAYELLDELYNGKPPVTDEEILRTCHQLFEEDPSFTALLGYGPENKLVALMTVTEVIALFAKGRFGLIMEFYVDPAFRSMGVGESLIAHASELGRRREWSCLELNSPGGDSGERAGRFYRREGFREIGPMMRLDL